MKFISLFSGIGGFDLAFERAGMVCDTVCEIDKDAQKVLRRHFPHARLVDDVRKVGKQSHERKSIDLICGGFPCQDLSIAGKRAGLAGERSGLWFEFARIIDELEPQWVVIENVPGLLSSNKGRDFAVILYWLVKRGYGVCWRVLDAQYFGVPQRRRRVFVVASFGNGSAAEVLFESDSGERNTEPSGKAGEVFAFYAGQGAKAGSIAFGNQSPTLKAASSGTNQVPTVMAHGQANAEIVSDGSPSLTRNHEAPILFQDVIPPLRAAGGVTSNPTLNKNNTDLEFLIWHNHQQDDSIRIQDDGTIPTVSRQWGTGGNNVPFVGVRRLMPIECERLQGFPDGWTDEQSDSARYRQLGNAVAVPVVSWLAQRIKAKACLTPREPDRSNVTPQFDNFE